MLLDAGSGIHLNSFSTYTKQILKEFPVSTLSLEQPALASDAEKPKLSCVEDKIERPVSVGIWGLDLLGCHQVLSTRMTSLRH